MGKNIFGPEDFDDDIEQDLTILRNEGDEGPTNSPNLKVLLEDLKNDDSK